MEFSVVIPDEALEEIRRWNLSPDAEDLVYRNLEEGLAYGHETTCTRLSAPSPTFGFEFSFEDPDGSGVSHAFLFYLTYGPLDDALYVMSCWHREVEEEPPF